MDDETTSKMRAYYAHCMSIYNTPQEHRDRETIRKMGLAILDPNHADHQAGYQREGMTYFLKLIDKCEMLVFRALPDGRIPAGVASEIQAAITRGMPVLELPVNMLHRRMTVEQTREYLRECGYR